MLIRSIFSNYDLSYLYCCLNLTLRYEILTPNVIPKSFMDGREAVKKMIEFLELESNLYRIGQSKCFFRAGVLAHLEEERDMKLSRLIVTFQAYCRLHLAKKMYAKRLQQNNALRIIQRNGCAYLKLRNWDWWRLFTKVKPLLEVTQHEEIIKEKEIALQNLKEQNVKHEDFIEDLKCRMQQVDDEKENLLEQLRIESENCAMLENAKSRLIDREQELRANLNELENRLEKENEKIDSLTDEKQKLQEIIQALEDQ
uniref:Myosin motor domain-containing protein n=1 Tax=Romanomermis culicivorax TaxID=13658 RepID=A0A915I3X4_ROMCU